LIWVLGKKQRAGHVMAHPGVRQRKNAIKAAASTLLWIYTTRFLAQRPTPSVGKYVD
jgi:hypothetical protein